MEFFSLVQLDLRLMNIKTFYLFFCFVYSSIFCDLKSLDHGSEPSSIAPHLVFNARHSLNRSKHPWDIVYLASFPRSGNHWLRFLIEEATGIATSSAYRDLDYLHLSKIFPWGGYCTDRGYNGTCRYPTQREPVVVKTHYPCFDTPLLPHANRVICLIRNPIDTFYSYYVYKKEVSSELKFDDVLCEFIREWREFYEFWERHPGVLMIRYEDLYQDPSRYLAETLRTVDYRVRRKDIQRAVTRYPPRGGLLKHLEHVSASEMDRIKHDLRDLLLKYKYHL